MSRHASGSYDALAVAAYHAETEWPVVRLLVCDDAPQWTWLSEELGLCWVHEGRHYKKLTPWIGAHRVIVNQFLTEFWQFYDELLCLPRCADSRETGAASRRV